jgi:MEMO1 family protein
VIFGTDHFSEGYPITLTRQNYATPFGVLPTDTGIVDQLAGVLGEEAAFAGELHHRQEHSIELAAVWMHYMRKGRPIHMVPILTGSLDSGPAPLPGERLDNFLDTLQNAARGRKTIVVAAGDLAHVGPAFDTEPVTPGNLVLLKDADNELIQAICQGNAEGFYQAIQRVQDRNNVCGVAPIYLTLRLLAPLKGSSQGYAVCPADQANTSVVTVCGVTLE